MLARILAAILVVFSATLAAEAQRSAQVAPRPLPPPPRSFPAEKFSTKPVQAGGAAASESPSTKDTDEQQHKRRWEERSRDPSGQLR